MEKVLLRSVLSIGLLAALSATASAYRPAADEWPATMTDFPLGVSTVSAMPARLAGDDALDPRFLRIVAGWLSETFGLPAVSEQPGVAFIPGEMMVRIRTGEAIPPRSGTSSIVALYDDRRSTIYLPANWSGTTPAEQSVLVHEMVHHLQAVAGMKFACPQEREQVAYAAQKAWLEMFGVDFFEAFDTDPMTFLVRTQCWRP